MQLQTAMLSTLLITLVAFIALGLAATVPLDSVDTRTLSITNRSSSIEVERRFIPSTTPKACLGTNIFCLTLQLDRRALGPVHPRGNVAWVYTHDDARWRTWAFKTISSGDADLYCNLNRTEANKVHINWGYSVGGNSYISLSTDLGIAQATDGQTLRGHGAIVSAQKWVDFIAWCKDF